MLDVFDVTTQVSSGASVSALVGIAKINPGNRRGRAPTTDGPTRRPGGSPSPSRHVEDQERRHRVVQRVGYEVRVPFTWPASTG